MSAISDTFIRARKFLWIALVPLLGSCGDGGVFIGSPFPPHPSIALRLEPIASSPDLTFPLFVTAPPGDVLRLFVVEKGGAIKIVDRNTNALMGTFLNISALLPTPLGDEQGLLGLAFDPLYASNRRFYVSYTDTSGNIVVARYLASSGNPNMALTPADLMIITVAHPTFQNHNGGMIAFGPDNFLYIGLGDGGSGGDPSDNAQNLGVLLGKMLRIDINGDDFLDTARNYAIPAGNPFVIGAGADEIWALGLRNPWRYSFDRQTGDLYVADVGQGRREEVNVAAFGSGAGRGINFGWDTMEGSLCFEPMAGCNTVGLALPVVEYDHSAGACSITGGYVYRGAAIPALQGTYFYADFCAGFVRSFRLVNDAATEQFEWAALSPGVNITSFGEDAAGELYIMTSAGGLFRIVEQ